MRFQVVRPDQQKVQPIPVGSQVAGGIQQLLKHLIIGCEFDPAWHPQFIEPKAQRLFQRLSRESAANGDGLGRCLPQLGLRCKVGHLSSRIFCQRFQDLLEGSQQVLDGSSKKQIRFVFTGECDSPCGLVGFKAQVQQSRVHLHGNGAAVQAAQLRHTGTILVEQRDIVERIAARTPFHLDRFDNLFEGPILMRLTFDHFRFDRAQSSQTSF